MQKLKQTILFPFIAIKLSLEVCTKFLRTCAIDIKYKPHKVYALLLIISYLGFYSYISENNIYHEYIRQTNAKTQVLVPTIKHEPKEQVEEDRIEIRLTPEEQFVRAYSEDLGFKSYIDNMQVRRNNPGNLRFHNQPGATDEGGFASFKTSYIGFRALIMQITADMNRGDTLEKFISEYAPKEDNNDTEAYIQTCESKVGSRKQLLSDIDVLNLAVEMVNQEHSYKFY